MKHPVYFSHAKSLLMCKSRHYISTTQTQFFTNVYQNSHFCISLVVFTYPGKGTPEVTTLRLTSRRLLCSQTNKQINNYGQR